MPRLTVASPLGPLMLTEEDGALVSIAWAEEGEADSTDETPLLIDAKRQLEEYFAGERTIFDLPLAPKGTEFEKKVWDELLAIPYGEVKLYGDIARTLGGIARAVGGACGSNPIPVVIPCHRVLGAGDRMTGYSGRGGVETKRRLLMLEGALLI